MNWKENDGAVIAETDDGYLVGFRKLKGGSGKIMTHLEYRTALAALGLSQAGAARLLGVDTRTSARWALAERAVPEPAARMLRLMIAKGITPEQALRAANTAVPVATTLS